MSENFLYGRRPVYQFLESLENIEKNTSSQSTFTNEYFEMESITGILASHSLPNDLKNLLELRCKGVHLKYLPRKELDNLYPKFNHQGIVITFHSKSKNTSTKTRENWKEVVTQNKGLLILLDGLQDVQNVGSIIRSAEALGVKALFLTGKGVKLEHVLSKVATGANFHLPIFEISNLHQLTLNLRKMGFWICASASESDYLKTNHKKDNTIKQPLFLPHTSIEKLPNPSDLALIIGSEGEGIRPLLLSESDFLISIPMQGKTQSLNAGVAAGILIDRIINRN